MKQDRIESLNKNRYNTASNYNSTTRRQNEYTWSVFEIFFKGKMNSNVEVK